MSNRLLQVIAPLITFVAATPASQAIEAKNPNIIVVLCDDLGFGDVRCLNPEGKIATPNFDRLASEGVAFTDAHSGSSVCTPTRYGVLTGRYAWRTKLQSFVLGGLSPRLIEPGRETMATMLKSKGYHTACIGKWHLGMNWKLLPGKDVSELTIETPEQVHSVDYSAPITDGPNAVGFDYYFGISASLDMVPYCFIENDQVTALPTEEQEFPLYHERPTGKTRKGPTAPGFTTQSVLPELTKRAVEYVSQKAGDARGGKPFFLYLPLNSPHTPVAPTDQWLGKSGLGPYGDFVMQTDDALGQVMAAIDKEQIRGDTLIVLTSDNGCSPQADFPGLIKQGHNPSAHFRGNKADVYDGGHRVPFIVSWPAGARAGVKSDRLTCLTDIYATCADIVRAKIDDNAAEDSFSFLSALTGKSIAGQPERTSIVHHSINGSFVIREGNWKLAFCGDSGGWSTPRPGSVAADGLPALQLFDMAADPSERKSVQAEHAEIVAKLTAQMAKLVDDGRSTPGAPQANAVAVDFRKPAAPNRANSRATGKGSVPENPLANPLE